jgi:2-polyprenyl-3-methyl-5-hydroxy-6-metoxy-1,4-benzoquinol methylase
MVPKTTLDLDFVHCCICGDAPYHLVGKGEDYEYRTSEDIFSAVQCDSCSLVYLNPRPAITEFERIYPPNYHAFDFSPKKYGFVYKVRERLEANRTLKRCKELGNDSRILDVGCGDGFHLNLLRKYGNKNWALEGIDLDKRAVDAANKSGLKVHLGSVEEIKLTPSSYDLVLMIQTIEHVEKPLEVILSIFNLLKPGGKLVIVTDNTDSLDFKYYKNRYWGGFHFPRHWNLFNKKSMTKLALKSGYQIEDISTIVSPVNWIYSIHNSLVGNKKPKWLSERFTLKSTFSLFIFTVADFVFQKFGKGALLQVTLRKPL